jgi:uncharacterized protein (TIGR04222 family)
MVRRTVARPVVRAAWSLPALLRPWRRLFIASLATAIALAWWFDRREMFLRVVEMSSFLLWVGGLAVYVGTFKVSMWREKSTPEAAAAPGGLDHYDAAWLSGGAWRMVATAMAMQVQRGAALIEPGPPPAASDAPPPVSRWRVLRADTAKHPVERAVASVARDGEIDPQAARRALAAIARDTGRRLREAGLAERRTSFGSWRLAALVAGQAVLVVALMHLIHALAAQHDDATVSDFCFVMVAVGWLALCAMSAGRLTAVGAQTLKPHQYEAKRASVWRARALGEAPEADRAELGARHPLDAMSVALLASSSVVDDPRFSAVWHLWPQGACNDAWRGSGEVRSIHDEGND